MNTAPDTNVAERQVVTTRVFDVPSERMFRAFSDPQQLALWWGPDGFTNTITKFEFRPGGAWHLTMHGPDGTDYHNESEFVEIEESRRIVYWHLRPMHRFQMSCDYEDVGCGRTRLTWRMLFDTVEECERVKQFVVPANEQNFDRLAAHLKANG
jgi:uncharacterized protein YndB with AHSA1/START domain